MSGYNDAVMHYPGIFVKTEILTPLVGCLQSTPESFSGNCFQWRRAALPKIKLQFREQSCLGATPVTEASLIAQLVKNQPAAQEALV